MSSINVHYLISQIARKIHKISVAVDVLVVKMLGACTTIVVLWVIITVMTNVAANDECQENAANMTSYSRYFQAMRNIHRRFGTEGTCLPVHEQCGWPKSSKSVGPEGQKLPLFVFSIGLEGAGHHLWTEILQKPVFDCVWINGRHYFRDLSDGVPRTTYQQAVSGFKESYQMRLDSGQKPCRTIYDAEDSFPTGAIRKSGRVFMRPDLVHLQAMDGVMFNLKYLIITRNVTVNAQLCYILFVT